MIPGIPEEIVLSVESDLAALGLGRSVMSFVPSSGGCINNGGKLTTSSGEYFIKWNRIDGLAGMFEAERRGLNILASTNAVNIPSVIASGNTGSLQYLVLEYVHGSNRSKNYWETLGRQLARLHRVRGERFGLDHDNYIGSLQQANQERTSWVDFFVELRLRPLVKMLEIRGNADSPLIDCLERIYSRLGDWMPEEPPSLLHGDLWSGNVITGPGGQPYLIDPAVYFGHREMELAFTRLFGGFDQSFYKSYEADFPLERGFNERYELYNLYPLLVHANLFGESYLLAVRGIIKHFS